MITDKILIVDDELHCRKLIYTYLISFGIEKHLIYQADTMEAAVDAIERITPRIIFMDIQLKNKTGFDVLDALPQLDQFNIVFTTAYNDYAIKAFDYAAMHYLLKPLTKRELRTALERCIENITPTLQESQLKKAKFMFLKTERKSYQIEVDAITHIIADGTYSTVFSEDGKSVFSSKNVGEFERNLPEHFFRIHKSILVNLNHVHSLNTKESTLQLKNETVLAISRRKKTKLKTVLQEHLS